MTLDHMFDNAGTASQHLPLCDDPVVRGAILRSMAQWLNANGERPVEDLLIDLVQHKDYNP